MTALPADYAWLGQVAAAPRMIVEALKLYGVHEGLGAANSPTVMGWRDEVNAAYPRKVVGYSADSIPWCGLFMAVVALRAGKLIPDGPLWALNWGKFGQPGGQPELGDTLVFVRPGGGHVGLYVGEDSTAYHCLGGNTHDDVSIARIDKHRLHACRQPAYTAKPASAVPHILQQFGALSRNEA